MAWPKDCLATLLKGKWGLVILYKCRFLKYVSLELAYRCVILDKYILKVI